MKKIKCFVLTVLVFQIQQTHQRHQRVQGTGPVSRVCTRSFTDPVIAFIPICHTQVLSLVMISLTGHVFFIIHSYSSYIFPLLPTFNQHFNSASSFEFLFQGVSHKNITFFLSSSLIFSFFFSPLCLPLPVSSLLLSSLLILSSPFIFTPILPPSSVICLLLSSSGIVLKVSK